MKENFEQSVNKSINNEIRPSLGTSNIEQLIDKLLKGEYTFKATVDFAGWVRRIDADSPAVVNDFRVLHHLERYWFAAKFCKELALKNLTVLDVGIGEAHGLLQFLKFMPSSTVTRTVGIEVDRERADRVRVEYPFLEVISANIEGMSLPDIFDIVFCYELMGNKSLSSDEILLRQLDKLCAPGGYIFLSIAAFGNTEAGRTRIKNYSGRIYDTSNFINIVNRMFPGYQVRFFGQLYPLKRMFESQMGVWENPGMTKDTDFLVCVARKGGWV